MAVDAATTFLFPGQGAQSVGMAVETCEAVPAAKKLFDEASEILGYDLLAQCAAGPQAALAFPKARPGGTHTRKTIVFPSALRSLCHTFFASRALVELQPPLVPRRTPAPRPSCPRLRPRCARAR